MYVSIDMGGTYTRIASSQDLHSIYKSIKFNTKKELIDQKNTISYYIKKLSEGEKILAICLGVPGTLDIKNKKYLKFKNYRVLENTPFDSLISDDLKNIPLTVVNDAHMAGYMEAVKGSGKEYEKVLYLSIGTGIGGIWVKNQNIDDIFLNFEPGHDCIFSDGLDFGEHCSGREFKRIYGIGPNNDTPTEIWKSYAKELSKGISFLNNKYPSDVTVLGGGFSVNNYDYFKGFLPENINIKLAKYGDESGILGGLEILFRKRLS